MVSTTLGSLAQTKPAPTAPVPAVERDRDAEKKVADALFRELREQGGMIPRLAAPTDLALQITCSTAVDWDLDREAEVSGIKIAQADIGDFPDLIRGMASSVLATKDQPSMWLVVFRTTNGEGVRTLTLGYSMVDSKMNHLKACFLTEDGCNDKRWQKFVVPTCRRFKQ